MPTGYYPRLSLKDRLLSKTKKTRKCWLWIGAKSWAGYGRIGDKNKTLQAQRASYVTFIGHIPKEQWVLHKCDNRACINPKHLFLGNRKINMEDCVKKKRHSFGKKSGLCKLSKKQVIEIIKLWNSGKYTQTKIGELFKTSGTNICLIVNRKSRRYLKYE